MNIGRHLKVLIRNKDWSELKNVTVWLTTIFLLFVVVLYSIIWFKKAVIAAPTGDELRYASNLNTFLDNGYIAALKEGCSIPFLLLNYIFYLILNDQILALKASSLFAGMLIIIFSLLLVYKFYKPKKLYALLIFTHIFNLLTTRATIYFGINDILLDLFGLMIMVISILNIPTKLKLPIMGVILGLCYMTRPMSLAFIGVMILTYPIYKLYSKRFNIINALKKGGIIFLVSAFTVIFFNSPIFFETGSISKEDKELIGSDVNWAQYDYYSALLSDQGQINRGSHPSIQETRDYLKKNGTQSLPNTFFEMIFFDWQLTIKEFFIDYLISLKYLIRLGGLIYPLSIVMLFSFWSKRNNNFKSENYWVMFSFIFPIIISLVIITNIQPRWFVFFIPFLIICSYIYLQDWNHKWKDGLIIGNNIFFLIINSYFIYNHI